MCRQSTAPHRSPAVAGAEQFAVWGWGFAPSGTHFAFPCSVCVPLEASLVAERCTATKSLHLTGTAGAEVLEWDTSAHGSATGVSPPALFSLHHCSPERRGAMTTLHWQKLC